MTRDEWAVRILDRIGQRGGVASPVDAALLTQVQNEFQTQQEELETGEQGTMPWFLEREYTDAAFKTVTNTFPVPVGFLRELDEVRCALFYEDTTQDDVWVPVEKADYDELKTVLGGTTPGAPLGYCILGDNYRVFPTPDVEYNLKAMLYMRGQSLATNVENAWLKYAPRVLVGKVGAIISTLHVRDDAASAFFLDMHSQGLAALLRDNTARKEAGRSRSMGED